MSEIQNYLAPRQLEEAVRVMAEGEVTVVCGGTDLTPQTDAGLKDYAETLMNIRRLEGISGVSLENEQVRIGALTSVTEIMQSDTIRELAPVLVQAGDQFASDQIRNAASIGGNLCNASPAGDMCIPLLVLEAEVELASWKQGKLETRRVPLNDFFTGPGKTVKADDELLTAVLFDKPADDFVASFKKSGPRPALEISKVSVGIGGRVSNGSFTAVRAAIGAVAATPIRSGGIENALEGKALDSNSISAAADGAESDATPIDDVRASAWYRNHLVKIYTEEVLNNVAANGN